MNIRKFWMVLSIALVSLCTMSCGDGDDDDDGGTRENPTTSADPAGTIAANLTNNRDRVRLSGLDTYYYPYIYMNSSNNLCTERCEIVSVGSVKGLSSITKVPETGWSDETAAIPGYGYVIRINESNIRSNESKKYARLYVVDYMESTTGGIMGCTIKYQVWEPTTK